MASFYLCPWATVFQYFTDTGVILSGGKVFTYLAGTSTPQATYTDITGVVPNANPIILNANGRLPNVSIWQPGGVALKIIVTDSVGNQIGPTFDQLQGIDDIVLSNSALANPASGFGADLVANAMRSYDIFATARAANVPTLQAGQTLIVDFEGGITVADGLGGLFFWNATSSATDDGINILKPNAVSGSGRYIRLMQQIEFFAVKGANTTRASNTTPSADPDLQVAIPNAGTYGFRAWLNDATGTSAGGLKGGMSFTGGVTAGYWAMNGTGTGVTVVGLTALNSSAQLESAQSGAGSLVIDGALLCTAGGTLSFSWAQQASNGTASLVAQGSFLRVTRLASATGAFVPVTRTYNLAATYTETIPSGASTMTIEAWGSGAGGGVGAGTFCVPIRGGGGGGGGYCRTLVNVAAFGGQTLSLTVGPAGTATNDGNPSTVSSGSFTLTTMTANGGKKGVNAPPAGAGGAGGTAGGGTAANINGNAGGNGMPAGAGGLGGAGIVGINGTGNNGGDGGVAGIAAHAGGVGLVIFHYV
jgi:hypothetical protein